MQFQPMRTGGGKWSADKLGEWVAEDEIVPGGSQHLSAPQTQSALASRIIARRTIVAETPNPHEAFTLPRRMHPHSPVAVGRRQGVMEGGLRFNTSGGSMQIASTDAGLANFGELTAYPSPVNTSADTATYGASFVCASNVAPEVPRREAR